ncbi:hypothetical protein F383_39075 [Gossypium arboreum]|uniref:Uncharacterized protein n=1 Tax=Gossypium arboreum TaxID=29729 RepID=A0A0B0MIZ1_GOSAR|nr:hypothetical protein F383_39075 [Gossypium arboreum]
MQNFNQNARAKAYTMIKDCMMN